MMASRTDGSPADIRNGIRRWLTVRQPATASLLGWEIRTIRLFRTGCAAKPRIQWQRLPPPRRPVPFTDLNPQVREIVESHHAYGLHTRVSPRSRPRSSFTLRAACGTKAVVAARGERRQQQTSCPKTFQAWRRRGRGSFILTFVDPLGRLVVRRAEHLLARGADDGRGAGDVGVVLGGIGVHVGCGGWWVVFWTILFARAAMSWFEILCYLADERKMKRTVL